jgi:hypothetical protein
VAFNFQLNYFKPIKMKKLSKALLVLLALLNFPGQEIWAKNKAEGTLIVKKTADFEIAGDGSAPAWELAEWLNLQQREEKPDTYETKVKVLYSETGIYFLFDCQDKMLVSTIAEDNQDLWEEDVVEVFLWTDETFPVYFEYELSPLNYELPIIIPNMDGEFLGWLPWHYEGERKTRHATSVRGGSKESGATVSAWVAEFFIPYALLTPLKNIPPKSGTTWRANMYRIDYDQGQTTFSWQKTEKTFHDYKKFGTFIFE